MKNQDEDIPIKVYVTKEVQYSEGLPTDFIFN